MQCVSLTNICPLCVWGTMFTQHRSASTSQLTPLTPPCWSILPHLTSSIPGHHPCRVRPPLPFFSACLAGTNLAQRWTRPSLTHLKRDDAHTQCRPLWCLCTHTHIANHKAQDMKRWPATLRQIGVLYDLFTSSSLGVKNWVTQNCNENSV